MHRVGDRSVPVEYPELAECPKSYVLRARPEVRQWAGVLERAAFGREAGASLYGPDLSRWPCRAVDALVVIESCRNRVQSAAMDREDQ